MVRTASTIDIYAKALSALATSPDSHLERLRWALSATDVEVRRPADPDELDTMVATKAGTRETAYTALFREGFLYLDLDRIALRRFDPVEMDEHQELLSAYESIAILQSASMNLKRSRPALDARYQDFLAAAGAGDRIGTALGLQRLMLTVVAAVATERLLRAYIAEASVAFVYAAANRMNEGTTAELKSSIENFYERYVAGDAVAAARVISETRAMVLSTANRTPDRAAS